MNWLEKLFEAQLTIGSQQILWREVIGNAFGFASAIGGLRRRVWAWPVGIVGNALLFTVFFGVAFSNPQHTTLFGHARPSRPAGPRLASGWGTSSSGSRASWCCRASSP
jgi:nicotinamide mononucleotide transporter